MTAFLACSGAKWKQNDGKSVAVPQSTELISGPDSPVKSGRFSCMSVSALF